MIRWSQAITFNQKVNKCPEEKRERDPEQIMRERETETETHREREIEEKRRK